MRTEFDLTAADIRMMEDAAALRPLTPENQDMVAPLDKDEVLDAIVARSIHETKAQERREKIKKLAKIGAAIGALSYAAFSLGSVTQRR